MTGSQPQEAVAPQNGSRPIYQVTAAGPGQFAPVVRRVITVKTNGTATPAPQAQPAAPTVTVHANTVEGFARPRRKMMECLMDQLDSLEEAESLRNGELAEKLGIPLDDDEDEDGFENENNEKETEIVLRSKSVISQDNWFKHSESDSDNDDGAMGWPGEELIFKEGFTPQAMLAVTNRIRELAPTGKYSEGRAPIISPALLLLMLKKAEQHLSRKGSKALIEFQPPPGQRVIIVGDLHGQLNDALWIFHRYGLPSEASGNCYLFNGDIADRGKFAVEIFVLAVGWMLTFPNAVFINRGNHEDILVNTSRCGGFYDECITKYPSAGRVIFEAFGKLFAELPLAHLFGPSRAKILVVHGGLPRVPSQFISTLKHMGVRGPTIPMRTCTMAEVCVKDCLWSDPKETAGTDVSTRGASLIQFGPDITLGFCHQELIGLIVRSHEVPPTGEGFSFMHQNRLCTVFSASNYKGVEHNSGAVLVITSALLSVGNLAGSVKPEVFYAPQLGKACAAELEPPQELSPKPSELERKTREATRLVEANKEEAATKVAIKKDDPKGELIEEGVLKIVGELVVAHKQELWQAFWDKDMGKQSSSNARNGFVSLQVWKNACETILGQKVLWDTVAEVLDVVEKVPPHRGGVDYNRFLHRFHVVISEESCVGPTWMEGVLATMVDKLLRLSVQDLLDLFDQDKNGRLSIAELSEAVKRLDVGLSSAQVRSLFLTFAAHCDESAEEDIEVETFLAALVVAAREQNEEHQSRHARARKAWPKWATSYLRHLGRDLWEMGKGDHHLLELFKSFDADGNGLLDPAEFVRIMADLQASSPSAPALALEPASLKELAKLSDFDGSGFVSYVEILLALQPTDTTLGGHLRFDLFEQICSTVWNNAQALLRALHNLDPEKRMKVDAETLTKALHQLNSTIGGDSRAKRPLLKFQIEALVNHVQFGEDGLLNYNDFVDAFQVKDCS